MTAMLVETFEVTEVDADGNVECDAEALELIEQLGLAGQQKLLTKSDDGKDTRCPYRKMTLEERLVYTTICPKDSELRSFSDSAIPVRVLQVAAHAVGLFEEIRVWSARTADIKDPVLVGKNKGSDGYTYEFFMLARWGEVLEPFDKLLALALDIARKSRKACLAKVIAECRAKSDACDEMDGVSLLQESTEPYLADFNRR